MKGCFAVWVLASVALPAQTISFGIRGGAPLTGLVTAGSGLRASTAKYTAGPTIEFHLSHGFALSVDLLYKRAELGLDSGPDRTAKAHRWELPVLVRREFAGLPARPFVGAGVALNRYFSIDGAQLCGRGPFGERFYCIGGEMVAELRHPGTHGPVIGTGVQFRFKKVWLVPELRLTWCADRNFGVRDSALRSNLMQVDFLVGIRF
jgi:hypothetical protein